MAIPDTTVSKIFGALKQHRAIALAVSGGPDSMAMMHLASRWCENENFDRGHITVLTVDHSLRAGSAEETRFVLQQAMELGYAAKILTWEHPAARKVSQATARDARYDLLLSHCRHHGQTALLTAHTADDQAETFAMRLKRGSGLDGLASINPVTHRGGITILRPLLEIKKASLLRFLRVRDLRFIEDPSNKNSTFERVRLRHQLNALSKAGVRSEALALSASRLLRCRTALDEIAALGLRKHFKITTLGLGEFPRAVLDELPDELRLRTFSAMIDLAGGSSPLPRLIKIENLLDRSRQPLWQASLGGCVLKGLRSRILIWRELGRLRAEDVALAPGASVTWDDRFEVTLDRSADTPFAVRRLGMEGWRVIQGGKRQFTQPLLSSYDAVLVTPALWRGSSLVTAPLLGWCRDPKDLSIAEIRLISRLMGYVKDQDGATLSVLGKQSAVPYVCKTGEVVPILNSGDE